MYQQQESLGSSGFIPWSQVCEGFGFNFKQQKAYKFKLLLVYGFLIIILELINLCYSNKSIFSQKSETDNFYHFIFRICGRVVSPLLSTMTFLGFTPTTLLQSPTTPALRQPPPKNHPQRRWGSRQTSFKCWETTSKLILNLEGTPHIIPTWHRDICDLCYSIFQSCMPN